MTLQGAHPGPLPPGRHAGVGSRGRRRLLLRWGLRIASGLMMHMFCMLGMCPGTGLRKLCSLAGVLLQTMYILHDTQMIVGGRHAKDQYSIDYASAAQNLHSDVISTFLYLLRDNRGCGTGLCTVVLRTSAEASVGARSVLPRALPPPPSLLVRRLCNVLWF